MRNGQKRMRGRGNHRKSQNPLTRVYESNGPDVKIRGTASHIAEKYIQLARDAQRIGDECSSIVHSLDVAVDVTDHRALERAGREGKRRDVGKHEDRTGDTLAGQFEHRLALVERDD